MDAKFYPAIATLETGDVDKLKALIAEDPSLATSRSTTSHPTLLQCFVLDGKDKPNAREMAEVLIDAGADLNEPLIAAGSINNRPVAELLIDRGAAIDGARDWSPLEEALYWDSKDVVALLLDRGAKIRNLRTAAALGRTDLIENYFNAEGTLKPEAGKINWPFGRRGSWSHDQQSIINNAFVYACMHGHIDTAKLLLEKGAEINVIPGGFDYAGTGLHYAAYNGHRAMVQFLLNQGADRNVKDTKVDSTAAGWAEHSGHKDLADLLR